MSMIDFLLVPEEDGERDLVLPNDMERFDAALAATSAKLVIIDPITDAVDMSLDAGKRQHVKLVARRLRTAAEQHQTAVLAINHSNRSQGSSARDRAADSIAWRQSFR